MGVRKRGYVLSMGILVCLLLTSFFSFSTAVSADEGMAGKNVAVLRGDANGDGVVEISDVIRVERILLGMTEATPGADANGDGQIDMGDVVKIERIILGLA